MTNREKLHVGLAVIAIGLAMIAALNRWWWYVGVASLLFLSQAASLVAVRQRAGQASADTDAPGSSRGG